MSDIDIDLTGKHVILSVARLVSNKGIDLVLKAMPAILRNMSNVHYMIVGDGSERPALEAMSVDLDIVDQVTFAGHQPYEGISAYYYASDIFVLTPRELQSGVSESFGVAYLEANVLGLPVVATNIGGVADAVVDGETGLLIDGEDPDKIAAAILRLLENPDLADRLAAQGRQRVLNEFTCKATADRFINAIEQILQTGA